MKIKTDNIVGGLIIVSLLMWAAGFIIFLFSFSSCKKDDGCKKVTVEIINGCTIPVTITYAVKDQQYCGSDLNDVRKLNNTYQDYFVNGKQCRVTTFVFEK